MSLTKFLFLSINLNPSTKGVSSADASLEGGVGGFGLYTSIFKITIGVTIMA